jgi:hypothetical protein
MTDTKIPRPQNAYILFRRNYKAIQRKKTLKGNLRMVTISTDAGNIGEKHRRKLNDSFIFGKIGT